MQISSEGISSSGAPTVRRRTASSLAKFLPNQRVEHKMAATKASVRSKPFISYAESNGSSPSAPLTPETSREAFVAVDTVEESEDELIKYIERKTSGRHSLRPRSSLTLSLKASENRDKKPNRATDVSFYISVDDSIRFTIEC